jgi:hypothetical protein
VPLPEVSGLKARDWLFGAGGTLGAFLVAAMALYGGRVPRMRGVAPSCASLLHTPYTGRTGDQVAWVIVGAAVLTTAFTVATR